MNDDTITVPLEDTTLKTALVTDGILTQARADEIFI